MSGGLFLTVQWPLLEGSAMSRIAQGAQTHVHHPIYQLLEECVNLCHMPTVKLTKEGRRTAFFKMRLCGLN